MWNNVCKFLGKKLRFNVDLTIVHKVNLLVCLFFQILDNLQLTLDISNSEGGLKGYIQYDQKRDSESSRYGIGISIGFTLKGPMKRVRHSQCHSTYYWVFEIWRANCTYLSVIRRRSCNRSINIIRDSVDNFCSKFLNHYPINMVQ